MRDSLIHEEVFFEFVKNHDQLNRIYYSDEPIFGQKIIGLLVDDAAAPDRDDEGYIPYYTPYVNELLKAGGNTIIDPNWDNIYKDFINLDHNLDSVEYIKNLVESKTTREEVTQLVIDLIVKKLINLNILSNNVYVVMHPHWDKSWVNEIVEV